MGALSHLEPKSVFRFFDEITQIPHGSGNIDRISDYLVDFAKDRNLFYIQDDVKNVIIVKEASKGYEEEPAVIIQGHMDMVAVKKPDCSIDMKSQGLQVAVDGDYIYAQGTSLGGDDGIAVAYALALLDADDIKHPRLEVVITVDEETGMDGARAIDLSMLQGKRLLNIDSEEEGILLTSCAGGARVKCELQTMVSKTEGTLLEIELGGLLGGHSGAEIHKERGNSNYLMGRVLYGLTQENAIGLVSLEGGLADNAIPRRTKAVVVTSNDTVDYVQTYIKNIEQDLKTELAGKDDDIYLNCMRFAKQEVVCATTEDTKRVASLLIAMPNGVQAMSTDMPGLVETSLNLGILEYEDGKLLAEFSVRSSVESAKHALIDKMRAITSLAGGKAEVSGDYPGWKYRKDSPLREKMIAVYEKMYGETPKIEAIHAGLECGILGSKIEDLDCISFGPDMKDIHTTEEVLSISSTQRVWQYLLQVLETKDR
ncbi:MAG: aminoacyl-histidine dipeptidase [Lachnospiraceae bacterium]|nr:aminoacyl-histidine dipeptidase [Lachnospiraceae bacterium]